VYSSRLAASGGAARLEPVSVAERVLPGRSIEVLDHGFVRLDDSMASDLSVVNAARVSFARRKDEMDESDEGLIRFLMRDRHGTPFEHNAFRFHVRAPIFVAREWFRHRIGCLTGDTTVTFVNVEGHTAPGLKKTIDELWTMWTRGERDGHTASAHVRERMDQLLAEGQSIRCVARTLGVGRSAVKSHVLGKNGYRDARWRVRRMRLRVLNEKTGEFGVGCLADVVDKGIQPVYRLTLADGKEISLTENHRLLTSEGWMTMRDAVGLRGSGDKARMTRSTALLTNGGPAHRDRDWLRDRRRQGLSVQEIANEAGVGYHTIRKWLARHDLRFTTDERRGRRPWNAGRRGYHIRTSFTEARREAIRTLCRVCHRAAHGTLNAELELMQRLSDRAGFVNDRPIERRKGWKLTARPTEVVAVAYVGMRQTYDLCVEGPWHNFVANGVVVHNSFNEFSMRYARATDDFYVPAAEDVRSQVGKPGAYSFEPVGADVAETTRETLRAVYAEAFAAYERLVELGVARELARAVMPVGAYTEFYWTVNARALMNFVSLRAAETAQREIRHYAAACEQFLAEEMPVTYGAFVASERVAP
jgi:thymidylate synthase ThyX/transposase